ncbi:hypothetical protein P167DRAFT_545024 [Morchella conica CCBAS932]|uniref:Myb-like domain-containing protein n=1 Tax=Morchella conica CCBAS932 TaxID=1392247 RepID=A0A3N4KR67_9PEZI|nr:hypothetical protein P167DRAFT_545024 [Morchella conica CCBAS932]
MSQSPAAVEERIHRIYSWLTSSSSALSLVPQCSGSDTEAEKQEQEEPDSPPPNPSRYEPPPNLLPRDDTVSSISVSEFFSTPEPDLSNTQIEIEELDVGLMLEMFPHLDAHSKKILDLLILKPPSRDLRRLLLVPGSSASKRLRTYEQNFAASKMAYGTSDYISVRQVESALGGDESFRPLLHASNLSILADVAYTSQGSGESAFEKLKQIERDFPVQFGDVVRNVNFQAALDLRTQYLVLALVNNQDMDGFNPDMWLKLIFFDGDTAVKRWTEMEDVDNWETRVLERAMKIRSAFAQKPYDDDPLDVAMLMDLFPWDDFVKRISSYIKIRFSELEKSRAGRSVEDLVENARNPQFGDDRERDFLDDREIPETLPDGTPVKPRSARVSQKLPEAEPEAVASTAPAVAADFERKEQQGRGRLESTSVAINAAQMRDLKRRKTMPAPETVPFVRGTPRVATSLGSKDAEVMTMEQMKFLKCLKNAPEKTAGEAGPSKQPEAAGEVAASKQAEAPKQAATKEVEASQPVESAEPMENAQPLDDEGDVSNPVRWMTAIKKGKEMKNKENDKSVASTLPPPQQSRLMKRKRFIDPQEGATRVSQIDDGSHGAPAKRQQLQKGKEREVIPEEVEESRPAFETEDQEEQDEDADMYQVDSRKEDEERTKRSRKGLPDIGPSSAAADKAPAASAAPRTSTSSAKAAELQNGAKPRKIAPMKGSRNSKGSRASGGTEASRKLSGAGEKSDVDEHNSEDEEYDDEEEAEDEVEEIDDEDESVNNEERRAALNQRVERIIKKDLARQSKPARLIRKRQPWGRKQTALLIRIIGERGCKWAEIRDMNVAEFSGRSNVQLKDKARNIKYDYLKQQLPPNFEDVTISRTQVQTLQHMGINCDDYI